MGGDQLSRPESARDGNARSHRSHGSDRDGACNCHEGCNGLAGSDTCRGTDADDSAHPTAAHDRAADASNCYTVTRLDAGTRCCSDPGDCADIGCGSAANRTA
jgi:hypothetical protein